MSIPLDRLYHHLDSLIDENIIIYLARPHGSKNLNDFRSLNDCTIYELLVTPSIVFHDQEPLDYDFLEGQGHPAWWGAERIDNKDFMDFAKSIPSIRSHCGIVNVYDKFLLCHSEKNSQDVAKYKDHFIDVYYWSHAIIAQDWFRFAEHDLRLKNNHKYDFLIYNRAWTGTREYRLKFVELLVSNGLHAHSLTSFSPYDGETHYTKHQYKNSNFKIDNFQFENILPPNVYPSHSSADYVTEDYNACGIDIVLETLFDSTKNHLTEKTLRPIACGKPFIIVSTPNSLEYLRSYGFKTYNGLIDETYDVIIDPVERLECIINEMLRISKLSESEKNTLYQRLDEIANYNKKLFFNKQWQESLLHEFITNFNKALVELESTKTGKYWKHITPIFLNSPPLREKLYACGEENIIQMNQYVSQLTQKT